MPPEKSPPTDATRDGPWPYIGVGCLTAPIGFFGGGMIAVLFAKIAGAIQDCPPPKDLPACHTFEFLWPGAFIGLIGLPAIALFRLRRGRVARDSKDTATRRVGGSR
jgi:hypothetical protein